MIQPQQGGTIGDLIVRALSRYGDRTAFIAGTRHIGYTEVAAQISRATQYLESLGIRPGDTVLQIARNVPEQWYVMAACYLAGFRSVTLQQPVADVAAQAFQIRHSEAAIVLYDSALASRIAQLRELCPDTRHWQAHESAATGITFWSSAAQFDPQPLHSRAETETIVRLGFTSGTTTGRPKGVLLASRALAGMTLASLADGDWPEEARVLCAEPIAGGFGNMIVPTLVRGGVFIILDDRATERFIEAVDRHKPTVALMMPPSLHALLEHPQAVAADWSSLRLLAYSGAALGEPAMRKAQRLFGPILCQIYGQTECPKTLTILNKADHSSARDSVSRSIGLPCSGMQVAILDEELRVRGPNEIGELCARGPAVMSGYWKEPELTSRALRGGWLHTGDLCYADEGGYIHFVEREEDVFRRDGRIDYPSRIERLLLSNPAITACAVIGAPDPSRGERAVAFVIAADSTEMTRRDIQSSVRRQLPLGPDVLVFADTLPITFIGRVNRLALRKRWADGTNFDTLAIIE